MLGFITGLGTEWPKEDLLALVDPHRLSGPAVAQFAEGSGIDLNGIRDFMAAVML